MILIREETVRIVQVPTPKFLPHDVEKKPPLDVEYTERGF